MAVTIGGTDWDIINVSITGSDTEITYTKPVKTFAFKSRSGVGLQLRRTDGAAAYILINPGEKASTEVILTNSSASASSLGFVRTDDGSADTLEAIVTFA